MRIVCIIQARMGSSRLPGKVMMDLIGEPMLTRDINRVKRAKTLSEIVVATTVKPADDVIEDLCRRWGWVWFRGSEQDVLDRYYRAALANEADTVVRITSDCPLIEPSIVDQVVSHFLANRHRLDYVSNRIPRPTFPIGLDTEVFSFQSLQRAWQEDGNPAWREHVTPYIYMNPSMFHVEGITSDVDRSHMRWTVDTSEDMDFVRKIYERFGSDDFSWTDVLSVLEQNPEWSEINRHVVQKSI
jgi:spore coat polysaccharide biosynthesis protein SpsF